MSDTDPITGVPTTLRGSAALLLWLLGFAATAGSVIGLLGDRPWFFDLFTHFRLQYAAALLLAVVGMLWLRKWKSVGVFGAALVLNAVLLAPLWIAPTPPPASGAGLRLVAFNVLTANRNPSAVIDWVNLENADLLIMQEVNAAWIEQLDQGLAGYTRLPTDSIREDNFGMAMYLRSDWEAQAIEAMTDPAGVPRLEVVIDLYGQPVWIIGVHTLPPVSGAYSRYRREQLAEAAQRVALSDAPVILAGDLNATRWSAPMRRLLRDTELRDSAEGFGLQGTWPSGLGWTGMIPIDHVLVSPDIAVEDRRVGPMLGSDHRPVVVDLRLP
ncbi:MAG: endonuclease/exonuclease/phosphatase family protein [Planctomycetota bacterium]